MTRGGASVVPSGIVYALYFVSIGVWTAYATVYYDRLGVDLALIGLLTALPAAVMIVGAPTWGLIADRLGDVRPPFLVAGLWAAGSMAVLALGPPLPWLALVVASIAVGTSGMSPLLDASTVERLGRDRHRFGQARAWGSLAFVGGSLGGGILVAAAGIEAMFLPCVVSLVAAGVAAVLLLGRTRAADPAERVGRVGPMRALGLLREPSMGLFFVGSVVSWACATGVMTFISIRVTELGGDARLAGVVWAVAGLSEVPLMLLFPRLARRFPVPWLIVAGTVLFIIRSLVWTMTDSAFGLVLFTPLGGPGFALVLVGTTALIAERTPSALRATAQALFSGTTFAIGSILGALLAGLIGSVAGIAAVFPASAAGSVVGTVLIWYAVARSPRAPGLAAPRAG